MNRFTLSGRLLAVLLFAGVVFASPVPCANYSDYQQLVTAGSCSIPDATGGGLTFYNFTFVGSATGSGTIPTASQMTFSIDDPGLSLGSGQSIYGFEFNPDLVVSSPGREDIQLSYFVLSASDNITSVHLLENAGTSGSGTAVVTENPDCGYTSPKSCTILPGLQVNSSNPHQDLLGMGPFIALQVFKDISVQVPYSPDGGFAIISQVRDSIDLCGTPEPATFALLGAGLLAVALARRRRPVVN